MTAPLTSMTMRLRWAGEHDEADMNSVPLSSRARRIVVRLWEGSGVLADARPFPEVGVPDTLDVDHLDQPFLQRGCGFNYRTVLMAGGSRWSCINRSFRPWVGPFQTSVRTSCTCRHSVGHGNFASTPTTASSSAARCSYTTSRRSSNEVHVPRLDTAARVKPSHCRSIGRPREPSLSRPVDLAW